MRHSPGLRSFFSLLRGLVLLPEPWRALERVETEFTVTGTIGCAPYLRLFCSVDPQSSQILNEMLKPIAGRFFCG